MIAKQLIWQQCDPGEIFAEVHPWITYSIKRGLGGGFGLFMESWECSTYIGAYPTTDEAKAAAQEHFNKFVQSFME